MLGRRIIYGAVLLAALAFQIFYDGYLAQFLLVCVIALPLLSLLLSLWGLLKLRLSLAPSASQITQGEGGQWQVRVQTPSALPVSRLTMLLTFRNSLTGQERRQRLPLIGLSGVTVRTFPMEGAHCGLLTCQLSRVKALDFLGLFALPISIPSPAHTLVLPSPVPREELPELPQIPMGETFNRDTPSVEDYELREYRPGDPLHSIHWKLSSKHESLVVREPVHSGLPQAALTFDLYGTPERLDRVLGRLWTASLSLIGRDTPHTILWLDPSQGQQQELVGSQAQLLACMTHILSRPAPTRQPQAQLDLTHLPPMPHLHILSGEEDAP